MSGVTVPTMMTPMSSGVSPAFSIACFAAFGTFFVDQYGVLHDGRHPYPGAIEALRRLKDAGRHVVLLSNSGRSAAYNARRAARGAHSNHCLVGAGRCGRATVLPTAEGCRGLDSGDAHLRGNAYLAIVEYDCRDRGLPADDADAAVS